MPVPPIVPARADALLTADMQFDIELLYFNRSLS